MAAGRRVNRTMQDLARTLRRVTAGRAGRTNVAGRANVAVKVTRGGTGRNTEARASQYSPIIQDGRKRG